MSSEEATFNRTFGRRVKLRREERKLSQEALGSLLGLSRTSVTNIEAGRQSVVAYTIRLLAQALETSADELLDTTSVAEHLDVDVLPAIDRPEERAFVRRALSSEETTDAQ